MSFTVQIDMRFSLLSGVHVTGEQGKLWADRALVVDGHAGRYPIIPATTLKGWLREGAERLLRGLGENVCDGSSEQIARAFSELSPLGENVCDGSSAQTICQRCWVCQVFGSPRRRSPFRFYDAVLTEAVTDLRMNVSLSRHRKTAYEERLFSTETAWQKTMCAKVSGLFASEEEAKMAAALLYFSAKAGFAIGGARSRGLGWLRLEEFQARLDDTVLPRDELAQILKSFILQKEVSR